MYKILSVFICFATTALTSTMLHAQEFGKTEYKGLIVETIYPIRISTYKVPLVISKPISKTESSFATPEMAANAHFSSMMALDFDWNNETWDENSLKKLIKDDQLGGRSKDYWLGRWKSTYVAKRVEIYTRIEFGQYILLAYREAGKEVRDSDIALTLVLKQTPQKVWKLTNELDGHPVVTHWNSPLGRVRVASEPIAR